jgi:NAD(P)-dependent dehydrogenase (short-subunit alcohol dehydrogenase family)
LNGDMSNVAIITGAGSGFGFGLTQELLKRGWVVYATDRDSVAADKTKPLGALARRMDVTNPQDITAVVQEAIADHGRIDLMVANAGFGNFSSVEETTPEEVRKIFEVNVFGVENSIRAVLPQMRKQRSGRIIITTSVVAHVSLVGLGWYSATKQAIKAVANALRQETRWLGIRVSTVEPGTSKTGFGSVAFGLLESGRAVSDYDKVMAGLNKWLGGLYRISPGPDKVVKKMVRAATAKHPRAHYPASWDVRALKLVFYVLPKSWLDAFVLWLAKH